MSVYSMEGMVSGVDHDGSYPKKVFHPKRVRAGSDQCSPVLQLAEALRMGATNAVCSKESCLHDGERCIRHRVQTHIDCLCVVGRGTRGGRSSIGRGSSQVFTVHFTYVSGLLVRHKRRHKYPYEWRAGCSVASIHALRRHMVFSLMGW
jgi:hypothetical protein